MAQLYFDSLLEESHKPATAVLDAVNLLARNGSSADRGAIFTRSEVVEFVLDLVGYTSDKRLSELRLLEPSFGGGDFLLPAISRLLGSWKSFDGDLATAHDELLQAVHGVELHRTTFERSRELVLQLLVREGLSLAQAERLTDAWLHQGDFLLSPLSNHFDIVIGNPPYVRQELIPAPLMEEYRNRYSTIYDRADLYVPFIERSLSLLNTGGHLGFICSDRWMKNRYGGPLRQFVADDFRLKVYVDMVNTPAFHTNVIAYPAITIISRETGTATRVASRPEISRQNLIKLSAALTLPYGLGDNQDVREVEGVMNRDEPWLLDSTDELLLVRRLEKALPTLEEVGCKVGIGVATGADQAFIGDYGSMDVETDRKLPLITTKDIKGGVVNWHGKGVINPYSETGGLVDLESYPKLKGYLESRKSVIAKRHCACKSPEKWYKTIDRIWPELTATPKLLIPDIKGKPEVAYEEGKYYPHHNLYYVTSQEWPLRPLQAILRSRIAELFVAMYSTKMNGGFLRFQAQYLRRIRIPAWKDVSESLRSRLSEAAESKSQDACNKAVFELYELNDQERAVLAESEV